MANIEFRTKFQKILTPENSDVLTNLVSQFCVISEKEAVSTLWLMTYSTQPLTLLDCDLSKLTAENLAVVRNELRFQYAQKRPDFLKVSVPRDCLKDYVHLENACDSITAKVIYEHISTALYFDDAAKERILHLLSSTDEKLYFGGIRSLQFSYDAALYLKAFHSQISLLYTSLYEHKTKSDEKFSNRPLARLSSLVKEAGLKLEDPTSMPDPNRDSQTSSKTSNASPKSVSGYKKVTAIEVLNNISMFSAFFEGKDMNSLAFLCEHHFDLNEVMSKKDQILNLLAAANSLDG